MRTICFSGRPGFDPSEAGRGGELGEGSYIIYIFAQGILWYFLRHCVFRFQPFRVFFKIINLHKI